MALVERIETPEGKIVWKANEVALLLEEATAAALETAAHSVASQAKQLIVEHDQVDTGFMLNSVYVVLPSGASDYNKAKHAAIQVAPDHVMDVEAQKTADLQALVVAGAEYAIYQEMRKSFLYKALELEAANFGGVMKTAAKGILP